MNGNEEKRKSRRFLNGADSFWVRHLTDAAARHIPIDRMGKFREDFLTTVMESSEGVDFPAEVTRHAGIILARLFRKPEDLAPVETKQVPPQAEPPKASTTEIAFDDFPEGSFDDIDLNEQPDNINPFYESLEAPLQRYATRNRHPMLEVIDIAGKKYTVVGTFVGTSKQGVPMNANCTTGNYRKIGDAGPEILVHYNGRKVVRVHEADNGRYWIWLLYHKPGQKLRFWLNVDHGDGGRRDDPSKSFRVAVTEDGYVKIR